MAVLLLMMLALPLLSVVMRAHIRARQKKSIEAAYAFSPANVHGGARFANNDDLRRAGLFK